MNGEVFGIASSLIKKQYTGYRSQSLIDLDSTDKKSSALNTVRQSTLEQDQAEVQSFSKISLTGDIKNNATAIQLDQKQMSLPMESPQMTT